jgi:hypothetical protein
LAVNIITTIVVKVNYNLPTIVSWSLYRMCVEGIAKTSFAAYKIIYSELTAD